MIKNSSQKEKWIWEWERQAFPYYLYLFIEQWRNNDFSPPVYSSLVYKTGTADAYLEASTLEQAGQSIVNKAKRNPLFLRKWKFFISRAARDLHRFCDWLEKKELEQVTDSFLLDIYNKSTQLYIQLTSGVGVIRNANRLLQEILIKEYQDSSRVALLLATGRKNFFIQEHEALLRIKNLIARRKITKSRLDRLLRIHTRLFFYLPCGYHEEKPLRRSDFEKRLEEILKSDETLSRFRRKLREQRWQRRRLIVRLRPLRGIRNIIKFGSTCTYFRNFIRGNLNRLQYFNGQIFKEIARRTGNQWQDIASLIPTEMEQVLTSKQKVKKRTKLVLFSDKKGIHLALSKEAEKRMRKFTPAPERHGCPSSAVADYCYGGWIKPWGSTKTKSGSC